MTSVYPRKGWFSLPSEEGPTALPCAGIDARPRGDDALVLTNQEDPMTVPRETTAAANPALDPESIARYLKGAPPETSQYEFFIGDWNCELRVHSSGDEPALKLRAEWSARWVHERRMLIDDLSVFLPNEEEVLGWLNLRTYSEETGCWEISGHRALAPTSGAITRGRWREGEMHLDFETQHGSNRMRHFVRFYEITPESFEWEWRQQDESERAWKRFASISARRAAGRPTR
jgi:hypothetical protein